MSALRFRQVVGTYLVLFLLAAAGAPHQHVNGLQDLLLDEPSDSGTLFENDGPWDADEPAGLTAFDIVQDHPCLACFNADFVSAPASAMGFQVALTPMVAPPELPLRSAESAPPRGRSSRAPPSHA